FAEEVEWKAVSPAKFGPDPSLQPVRDSSTTEWSSPVRQAFTPQRNSAVFIDEPPPPPPTRLPSPESIAPPRPVKPDPKPATPPSEGVRPLNLVSEHPWGLDPPPIDPGRRFSFRAEYLLWWTKLMGAPPLANTATLPAPPAALPPGFGLLGGPGNPQIL